MLDECSHYRKGKQICELSEHHGRGSLISFSTNNSTFVLGLRFMTNIFAMFLNCERENTENIFVKHLVKDKKVKNHREIIDKKVFLYLQSRLLSFYNMISDMQERAMSGRLFRIVCAPLFSAIAFRPKFFLSISKILKKVLGRFPYFFTTSLKFVGIFVHCRSSKLKMTPSLFFARMHTSTLFPKSIPSNSELETLPILVP